MARGFPDYFGFSTFPTYGTPARLHSNTGLIAVDTAADLFDINFKARLIGGNITVYDPNPGVFHLIILTIDDIDMGVPIIGNMLDGNYRKENESLIYLMSYNIETHFFTYGIASDITFGTRYYLQIRNAMILDISASGYLYYNIVQ